MKIAEIMATPAPDWFQRGHILSANDLERLDAAEFIEGDEWDYEWRFCEVPLTLLSHAVLSDADIKNIEQQDPGRMANLHQFVGTTSQSFQQALQQRPIVALLRPSTGSLKVLDGFHRITIASRMKLPTIPAVVAIGEPLD
jgi:hypothetical protein